MNAKECSESCNSLPRIFKERLWFFSNRLPRWEKIERSLTFHCSDFLIIWTLLILASVWRAQLCNTGTVQEEPGTREMLDHGVQKKKQAAWKKKAFQGDHNSTNHISVVFGESVSVWKTFACHQNVCAEWSDELGSEHRYINICCHWGCKIEQTDHFRTWPPYLHLPQPIKLPKKRGLNKKNFEMETWSGMKQIQQHQVAKLP